LSAPWGPPYNEEEKFSRSFRGWAQDGIGGDAYKDLLTVSGGKGGARLSFLKETHGKKASDRDLEEGGPGHEKTRSPK